MGDELVNGTNQLGYERVSEVDLERCGRRGRKGRVGRGRRKDGQGQGRVQGPRPVDHSATVLAVGLLSPPVTKKSTMV